MKKPVILDPNIATEDQQIGPLACWRTIFGNDNPVHIEIGSGKGRFLLNMARKYPQTNFWAIEWANKYFKLCADRMGRWGLTNVRVVRTDARDFIIRRTPENSVSALHVYFPDPWPKKRHHKRRLFIPQFCQAVGSILVPGGMIAAATDHEGYFQQIKTNLLAVKNLEPTDFPHQWFDDQGQQLQTNYQLKWLGRGRKIHQLAMIRRI